MSVVHGKPCINNKPVHCSKLDELIFNLECSISADLNINIKLKQKNHIEQVCSRVNQSANHCLSINSISTYR